MLLPNCGPLPQRSHFCAMTKCSNPESQKIPGDVRLSERSLKTVPGKGGTRSAKAPDRYRVKGSLPIRNHTMPGVVGSILCASEGHRQGGRIHLIETQLLIGPSNYKSIDEVLEN
jgi:hypothetical protein